MVTIPRDVMRQWEKRHVRHVLAELHDDELRLRPLPHEELVFYPRSEEEDFPAPAIPERSEAHD